MSDEQIRDWPKALQLFSEGASYRRIADAIGTVPAVVYRRAKSENWSALVPARRRKHKPAFQTIPGITTVKNTDGRLRKDTPAARERVLVALRSGATYGIAAAAAGVSPDTLNTWRNESPEFKELCDAARGDYALAHLQTLDQAGRKGSESASKWILERHPMTKSDFGAGPSGAGGVTIVLNIARDAEEARGITIEGETA